jgi:hypothetical protein
VQRVRVVKVQLFLMLTSQLLQAYAGCTCHVASRATATVGELPPGYAEDDVLGGRRWFIFSRVTPRATLGELLPGHSKDAGITELRRSTRGVAEQAPCTQGKSAVHARYMRKQRAMGTALALHDAYNTS